MEKLTKKEAITFINRQFRTGRAFKKGIEVWYDCIQSTFWERWDSYDFTPMMKVNGYADGKLDFVPGRQRRNIK